MPTTLRKPKQPISLELILDEIRLKEPYTFGEVFACLFNLNYTFHGWKTDLVEVPNVAWTEIYNNKSKTLFANHQEKLMYAIDQDY